MNLNEALQLYHAKDARLHKLRNTWPMGIKSVDDETDGQIAFLTEDVKELKLKIQDLRNEDRRGRSQ